MFERFKETIKKAVFRLFGVQDVKQALKIEANISDKMAKEIIVWKNMYEDTAEWVKEDVHSLGLPSAIATELAKLTTLECKSSIDGSKRAEFLNEIYQRLMQQLRVQTEYACAKGGIVFRPFVSRDKIAIDFVHADKIIPLEFDSSGDLVSCVFPDVFTKGDYIYTRLEHHEWHYGSCTITNKAYKRDKRSGSGLGIEIPLSSVEAWADIEPETVAENLKRPLFSYFKIPLANVIDSGSDLGVSVFSKAKSLIQKADEQYSRILWEYEGSELAIDADEAALRPNLEYPKRTERLFRKLDLQGMNGNDFYSVFSPQIRDSSLFNGLNKLLQRIEFACGLAYGTLSDMQEVAKTATEIVQSRQRSYATVADIQKGLQSALENLIISMDELATLYNLCERGEYEVSFEWDDSLVVDSNADNAAMLQEVAAGIIKPEIYLQRKYGLTEEQCKEWLPVVADEFDDEVEEVE